ncbi:sensor histidine kinase [Flavobacterium sp. I3-2]|uniref:sensor histidine kinase n=1 Tax=Flavobacterium sp. I3-2 TaxID=2748319 RepID=UPI0015AD6D2F|nr:HAMP domain-containing sensor histidine kinase [Flavobacterium sp. I3-2]
MRVSLKNYTLKYLIIALLAVIAIWSAIFYAFILDEVNDNIDDGLKDQKIHIIREAYIDDSILNTNEFGINQFRITKIDSADYEPLNRIVNQMVFMEYDGEYEPYRVLTTGFIDKDGDYRKLEIRTSTVEEDDFGINLLIALFVLYVFIIIGIFFINKVVLDRVWAPFYDILQRMNQYQFGSKRSLKDNNQKIVEFYELQNELQTLVQRNEHMFESQKSFIENASHELQTPLAISLNKIDLVLENENLDAKTVTDFEEIKKSLKRMKNLNKSLLMLSKIENNQFEDKVLVNWNEVFKTVFQDFEDVISFKEIQFELKENGIFETKANLYLIEILLSNLLRNAIKYIGKEKEIVVHISENSFEIQNSGNQIALNPNYIYNRFYKAETDETSSGLGLSIVQSIIKQYDDLLIQYQFTKNKHHFKIVRVNS